MATKVMLLGVYHFGEQGSHLIETKTKDILSDEKQKELTEVIELISVFKPTKVAVEVSFDRMETLQKHYNDYLRNDALEANDLLTNRNEVYQLAFPIAKKFKHEHVYAIDYPLDLPTEALQVAQTNHPLVFSEFMDFAQSMQGEINELLMNETILSCLRYLNKKERVDAEHSNLYLKIAQVGSGATYDGVSTLSAWYKRNLHIFSNIQNHSEADDRILVLIGAGHIKILSELINAYNEMELEDTMKYLNK